MDWLTISQLLIECLVYLVSARTSRDRHMDWIKVPACMKQNLDIWRGQTVDLAFHTQDIWFGWTCTIYFQT